MSGRDIPKASAISEDRPASKRWLRAVDGLLLSVTAADHRVERRAYQNLSTSDKVRLVTEVATTRAQELCRAYRNVVAVNFGYRQRRNKQGQIRIRRELCVVFVVRRKWRTSKGRPKSEHLPRHLLAFGGTPMRRVLCAVPTDVEDAGRVADFKAAAGPSIEISSGDGRRTIGQIACVVRRKGEPGARFVLSCRHVFSLSKTAQPDIGSGLSIILNGGVAKIGETIAVRGPLADGLAYSFDAQLGRVIDEAALKAALGNLNLLDHANNQSQVSDVLWVSTSRGAARCAFVGYVGPNTPVDYDVDGLRAIVHGQLIRFRHDGKIRLGDSGGAVTNGRVGGRFIGMLIATNSTDGVAIPAWQLFYPQMYRGTSPNERWSIERSG